MMFGRRAEARTEAMRRALALIAPEQATVPKVIDVQDEINRTLIPSPGDVLADFLLNVAQVQETTIRDKIAVGSIPYDVERSMSERMSATRRVVHYYRIAVNAYSEGPHDDPEALSLPGITLALAILADSHPRAPSYVDIAPYTQQILEDYS